MKIIAVIPARFASTRFPGKPLVDIQGMSMIQRVYMQAKKVAEFSSVIVATDDERIFHHVQAFGGEVVMTSPNHISGTDRIGEVLNRLSDSPDVVVNIQGDEPFIQPEQLQLLLSAFHDHTTQIATLVKQITSPAEIDTILFNIVPNNPPLAAYATDTNPKLKTTKKLTPKTSARTNSSRKIEKNGVFCIYLK